MTASLVDSNVLLDILMEDPEWIVWSANALERALETGRVFIDTVIYAEASVSFDSIDEFESALPALIEREPIPDAAAFLAGKAFMRYRRLSGTKTAPLADFFIGAHAAVAGYRLLTRDPRRYRAYFPTLELITPL